MTKLRKDFPHVLLSFNKRYGNPSCPTIAVVEGKDEDYYRPRLTGFTQGAAIYFIDADGKDNVIDMRMHLKKSPDVYDPNRYVLFADRDFDDAIGDDRLYITSRHSVENFYTCPESFKSLLSNKFGLSKPEYDNEVDAIVVLYKSWMHKIAKEALDFTAWLYWQLREAPRVGGRPPKLNLNGTNFSNFFEIKFNSACELEITKKFTLQGAKELFPDAAEADIARVQEIVADLNEQDFFDYFRGKFIIEIYKLILEGLKADSRKDNPSFFREKRKSSLVWSNQILAELSSFAETPSCLSKFLRAAFP
ncbi:DUF4435 domain-containing protein [Duganella sp. S19_KUP01_CR8]|uniref:DUF4435 domain-containing protein n=1 Tax=Duganella sp. S19_KUP01_CR8 TaxID=3025502 RepID=UPI002FCD9039